jgi:hypothetical protein
VKFGDGGKGEAMKRKAADAALAHAYKYADLVERHTVLLEESRRLRDENEALRATALGVADDLAEIVTDLRVWEKR